MRWKARDRIRRHCAAWLQSAKNVAFQNLPKRLRIKQVQKFGADIYLVRACSGERIGGYRPVTASTTAPSAASSARDAATEPRDMILGWPH